MMDAMETLKTMKIYKENNEFVIEASDHAIKQVFATEMDLKARLDAYLDVIHEYKLDVSDNLLTLVIHYLKNHFNM